MISHGETKPDSYYRADIANLIMDNRVAGVLLAQLSPGAKESRKVTGSDARSRYGRVASFKNEVRYETHDGRRNHRSGLFLLLLLYEASQLYVMHKKSSHLSGANASRPSHLRGHSLGWTGSLFVQREQLSVP